MVDGSSTSSSSSSISAPSRSSSGPHRPRQHLGARGDGAVQDGQRDCAGPGRPGAAGARTRRSRAGTAAGPAASGCRSPASGRPPEIESRSASWSLEIAAKAIAPLVNGSALSSATGATILAASASSGKKRSSWVVGLGQRLRDGLQVREQRVQGLDRLVQRGARGRRRRCRSPPGPCGSPPWSGCRRCCRCRRTRSAPRPARSAGSPPPGSPFSSSPRSISRYLRPNEDR